MFKNIKIKSFCTTKDVIKYSENTRNRRIYLPHIAEKDSYPEYTSDYISIWNSKQLSEKDKENIWRIFSRRGNSNGW